MTKVSECLLCGGWALFCWEPSLILMCLIICHLEVVEEEERMGRNVPAVTPLFPLVMSATFPPGVSVENFYSEEAALETKS